MSGVKENPIKNYLSLVKFSHTIFAMPFAFVGFFIAVKSNSFVFKPETFILVLLCMIFARNAAMAFNRYADREFDKKNPRTAIREIPRGIIQPGSALKFVILNAFFFIITTWFINRLVFFLSPVALIVILGYSITKRYTALSHFVLGLGLSLAPIGAYLAVTGVFNILPLLFSGIVLFWVSGFDIIYAMQDIDFDNNVKLKSVPVWLGKKNSMLLSVIVHIISAGFVIIAGFTGNFGILYLTGGIIFISLLVFQHIIIGPDNLKKVNIAFFTTNGIASIIYSVFTIADLYFHYSF